MLVGAVLQGVCVLVNLAGDSYAHFLAALVLLGLGWNFLFVGATHLLTETYSSQEKAKAQGFNDLLVFATVTFTATSSGYLHFEFGWRSLNLGVIPFLVVVVAAIAWLKRVEGAGADRLPPAHA
jgi:MFS family permease